MRLREPSSTRTATLTERGVRPVNQDAVLSARFPDGSEIIAVADGMGGQAAGEVASRLALGILETALRNGEPLDAAVQAANTAVFEEARVQPDCAGMGTTIVAVHRYGDEYMVANVGDSRAYRIDDNGIRQLTLDHSFVAEARRAGALHDADRSPWRNAVTRAVGTDAQVQVDCFGPHSSNEPHSLLLCTDGLYRVLSDEQLRQAVHHADPAAAARNLVDAAAAAGSSDNISLAIIEFAAPAAPARAPAPPALAVPVSGPGGSQNARSWHDWKSTADTVMFSALLLLVIYLAVAALTRR